MLKAFTLRHHVAFVLADDISDTELKHGKYDEGISENADVCDIICFRKDYSGRFVRTAPQKQQQQPQQKYDKHK